MSRRKLLAVAAASAAGVALTLAPGTKSGLAQDGKGAQIALEAKAAPSASTPRVLAPEGTQFITPPDPAYVQAKCEVVGRGFRAMHDRQVLAKLEGPPTPSDAQYEAFVYQWIREGCRGDVPYLGTAYSGRWFNAAAGTLRNSSYAIKLVP
jgi:hypothetical protein